MKPAAAIEKPTMMNGERCFTLSDQNANMIVMIMANTYMGIVRS
jgi:hypothetical protein